LEYLVKELNGIYAIWLTDANRYILFREPGFRVFRLWAEGKSQQEVIENAVAEYKLPLNEAERFTTEILQQIRDLLQEKGIKENTPVQRGIPNNYAQQNIQRIYDINGNHILIRYGNSYIDEHIQPGMPG
jgi:polyhydroxyalkanoate synthesis regulator phasin